MLMAAEAQLLLVWLMLPELSSGSFSSPFLFSFLPKVVYFFLCYLYTERLLEGIKATDDGHKLSLDSLSAYGFPGTCVTSAR